MLLPSAQYLFTVRGLSEVKDCLDKGLLRKVPPSREKSMNSIRMAEEWLKEAERSLSAGALNSSLLCSYLSMFHSARAILFRDGYREKSHYCIARYLEEVYAKKGLLEMKWIDLLDHYRDLRHASQYSTESFVTEEEAKSALDTAKGFLERMKRLLETIG